MKLPVIIAAIMSFSLSSSVSAQALDTVKLGWLASLTDAALFIAIKKNYFADERIEISPTEFKSGANMVLPLGTGELDAAAGSPSAGLYNAIGRDIKILIVADKTRSSPGYSGSHMIIRKDLVETGRFKNLVDLKGLKLALNGAGNSNTATVNFALTSAGLRYDDIDVVDLSFPDHLIALQNRSVDGSNLVEPFASAAVARGLAIRVASDDVIDPQHQLANILFSSKFAARKELGIRFMRAYLRGARFYLEALKDSRFAGTTGEEVISILAEFTAIKDKAILRSIMPSGIDPNGTVNISSLQKDADFYLSRGWLQNKINIADVVDHTFVDEASKSLGRIQ